MKGKWILILALGPWFLLAQNLMQEKIRKIEGRKKSVFLSRGVFHNGGSKLSSKLQAIRHNYSKAIGHERLVFEFTTEASPQFYGHIDGKAQMVYLDLFKTELGDITPGHFKDSKYVKNIDFFSITEDSLSVEISFREKVSADIFYLGSPGRFVVDVRI